MDELVVKLDALLRKLRPETEVLLRERISELLSMADQDALDIGRSRAIEQEVLDHLDDLH